MRPLRVGQVLHEQRRVRIERAAGLLPLELHRIGGLRIVGRLTGDRYETLRTGVVLFVRIVQNGVLRFHLVAPLIARLANQVRIVDRHVDLQVVDYVTTRHRTGQHVNSVQVIARSAGLA